MEPKSNTVPGLAGFYNIDIGSPRLAGSARHVETGWNLIAGGDCQAIYPAVRPPAPPEFPMQIRLFNRNGSAFQAPFSWSFSCLRYVDAFGL
jgi:hypothetical protein